MRMPNIGVVGRKRSGKDTIAQYLVKHHGYARVGLADAVKEMALILNPIVHAEADTEYDYGYGGEVVAIPAAKPVYLDTVIREMGWEDAKDRFPEVRRILQTLGTDVIRNNFGTSAWIDIMLRKAEELNARGVPVVVPDVRFPDEANVFRHTINDRLIRVARDDPRFIQDDHESEQYADTIPVDFEIDNNGSLEDLREEIEAVIRRVRG